MAQQPLDGFLPQRRVSSGNTPFNALSFFLAQALGRLNTATLVKVVAVHIESRTGPVGTVDVQPLVDMADGAGQAQTHTTVFGIPYFRLQGGAVAFIIDPRPGDIGFCLFADRDISKVKASGDHALPGSERRFDFADGLYLGGWNNADAAPTAYVVLDSDSADVVHPTAINLQAPNIKLDGAVEITQALTADGTSHLVGAVTGDASATFAGDVKGGSISLETHKHTGVTTGGGTTGGPI
jgi:hypothetical protein